MKEAVILLLSFERFDMLQQTLKQNIDNAGCEVDVIALDQGSKDPRVIDYLKQHCTEVFQAEQNIGIGAGLNFLLHFARTAGYQYFQFMANDIMEQDGWIDHKIAYYQAFPEGKCGIISTWPGAREQQPYPRIFFESAEGVEYDIWPGDVIGQFMLTRAVVDKVGYFNTFNELYGPIDNDYNARCHVSGLINFYIPCFWASHLDKGDDIYGYNKSEKVAITWPQHVANVGAYTAENAHIGYKPVDVPIRRL